MSRGVSLFIVAGIFGLAILIGGAAGLLYLHVERRSRSVAEAHVGGPFRLTASDGERVTEQSFRGKWELIYFGYTRCPDECPMTLARLGRVLNALGPDASKLKPLFISVDPKHDTPQVMANYMKAFDNRIVGLTGTKRQIDKLTDEFKVYVGRPEKAGVDAVEHSGYLYLLNRRGKFSTIIDGDLSGRRIVKDLRKKIDRATS